MIKEDFLRNIVKDDTVTGVSTTSHMFHKYGDTIYTLLLERAPNKTHPGTKESPGGKVDKNEELQKAAYREVCEETRRDDGILVHQVEGINKFTSPKSSIRYAQVTFRGIFPDTTDVDDKGMPNIAYGEDEISNHMWATRSQVEDQLVRGKAFEFTGYSDQKKIYKKSILDSFDFMEKNWNRFQS